MKNFIFCAVVRASALLRIIKKYSYVKELWDEYLVNETLTTKIKSRNIGCQSQMGKFDLFFGLHLGNRLYSHMDNLSKSLQSEKKCLVPLVSD